MLIVDKRVSAKRGAGGGGRRRRRWGKRRKERKKEKYTFEDKYVCAQARTYTSVKMFFAYETEYSRLPVRATRLITLLLNVAERKRPFLESNHPSLLLYMWICRSVYISSGYADSSFYSKPLQIFFSFFFFQLLHPWRIRLNESFPFSNGRDFPPVIAGLASCEVELMGKNKRARCFNDDIWM